MVKRRRPEWDVQLFRSNYKEAEGMFPRIVSRGTITSEQLAAEVHRRTGSFHIETTKAILATLADIIEESLVGGYSVSTELGTLYPVVTGLWNFDRIQPEARAQNQAEVRYTMSPRLKEQLSDPLFHAVDRRRTGSFFYPAPYHAPDETGDYPVPLGEVLMLKGRMLLMNGEEPSRGLYLIDAATGEERAYFAPGEMLMNSRSQLIVRLRPEKVSPGRYRLKVVSQCSTGPQPLKTPQAGESTQVIRIE